MYFFLVWHLVLHVSSVVTVVRLLVHQELRYIFVITYASIGPVLTLVDRQAVHDTCVFCGGWPGGVLKDEVPWWTDQDGNGREAFIRLPHSASLSRQE